MKPYKPWDFCKSIDCDALSVVHKDERMKKVYCHKCYAYQFHQYLRDHDQILEEGSSLARVIQATNQRAKEYAKKMERYGINTVGFKPAPDHPKPDYRPPAQPTRYTREGE